jgi:hypothetical protein
MKISVTELIDVCDDWYNAGKGESQEECCEICSGLEGDNDFLLEQLDKVERKNKKLKKENKRLRKVLESMDIDPDYVEVQEKEN